MSVETEAFTGISRTMLSISSDGTRLIYIANARVYLRSLADLDGRPIAGTANATALGLSSQSFRPMGSHSRFGETKQLASFIVNEWQKVG